MLGKFVKEGGIVVLRTIKARKKTMLPSMQLAKVWGNN